MVDNPRRFLALVPNPIEKLTVSIEDYNEGEAMLVEAVADDGSIYAVDKVYPFPLVATDGPCQVWAELVDESRKQFLISGWGFEAGEQVNVSSTDGHDPKEFMQPVEESGGFLSVVLHGRSGGTAVFSADGAHCQPTLTYPFGNKSKGVQ